MALSVRRRDIHRRAGRSSASAELGRSLRIGRIGLDTTRMRGRRESGPPVYTYEAVPGVPPVSATRLGRELSGRPAARAPPLPRFPRSHLLRAGRRLDVVGEAGVANRGRRATRTSSRLERSWGSATRAASKWPRAGPFSSRPRSSVPGRPEPSSPGAPTRCSSPSLGRGGRRPAPKGAARRAALVVRALFRP
jgi:hypothetical protein